jgi:hypothetical protein
MLQRAQSDDQQPLHMPHILKAIPAERDEIQ